LLSELNGKSGLPELPGKPLFLSERLPANPVDAW
jgi:hypothetical protein